MNKTFTDYRPDIDGLRAIAVWIVVAYHASFYGFTGGFIGVDVFFVISGYLITGHLFKELNSTGTISFVKFYSKRFKRLFPAIFFVITVTLLLWGVFFLGAPPDTKSFIKSIQYSIFGVANIFFKNITGGYFDSSSDEMPFLHFWSLAVEEQFYLVWPWLLILSAKVSFGIKSLERRVIFTLVCVIVGSYVLTEVLLIKTLQKDAFYLMPARAWELGIGGLLFFLRKKVASTMPCNFLLELMNLIGVLLIVICTIFYDSSTRFPGIMATIPVLATALVILFGNNKTYVTRFLESSLMVRIGILSYGWYLWHWPFLALLRIKFMGELPSLEWRIGAVVLSLIMAKVSLVLIESPVRYGQRINKLKPVSICVGTLLISGLIVLASTGLRSIEKRLIPGSWENIIKLVAERTNAQTGCIGDEQNDKNKKCVVSFVTEDTKKLPEIIIWGDSHAQAIFPMFEQFAELEKLRVSLYSEVTLLPLSHVAKVYVKNKVVKDLKEQNSQILHRLPSSKSFSIVLVSRWPVYVGEDPISVRDDHIFIDPEGTLLHSLKYFRNGLIQTLIELSKKNVHKILIVLPVPEFKFNISKCMSVNRCAIPYKKLLLYRANVDQIIADVSSRFPNIKIFDPLPTLCDSFQCPQIIKDEFGNQIPVTTDDDHLSVPAAKYLGRMKAEELKWLVTP